MVMMVVNTTQQHISGVRSVKNCTKMKQHKISH